MKKVFTLLISTCMAAILFCQAGMLFTVNAYEKTTESGKYISLSQLVLLKKYLSRDIEATAKSLDYYEDGTINSMDITALRRYLLGIPFELPDDEKTLVVEDDGYVADVAKPQLLKGMLKVNNSLKAEIEVNYFHCKDIITTSADHDNGFMDDSNLVRAVKDLVNFITD